MRAVLALTIALFIAAPASAARIPVRVAIGDQSVAMFDHPDFQRMKLKRVRYFLAWNAMDHDAVRLRAREYVQRARAGGYQVLIHLSTDDYTIKQAHRPSVSEYRSQMRRLVRYFRGLGVREFGAWNEANHASQPTWDSPNHAALFFREMYREVKGRCRTCAVVALDVLDQPGVERYMRRFYRRLSSTYRRRASVVGIHNYGDVNRKRTRYTRAIIEQARDYNRRTKFWLTETGGIVKFGASFPYSPYRAKLRFRQMFEIANQFRRKRLERLYIYQWTGQARTARFDAGITNPDGTLRPAYAYLRSKFSGYLR